jgi:hypothetical protein
MVARDPLPLSVALGELIAIRGFARVRGDGELEAAWKRVAGSDVSSQSRPVSISRGALTVSVENPPLLSELVSFRSPELLQSLKQQYPHLKIKTLKFKLSGT